MFLLVPILSLSGVLARLIMLPSVQNMGTMCLNVFVECAKSVRSHLEYLCHKNMAKCDNCSTAHAQRMAFQGLMQLDPQQCTSCCVQSHNANREHKTRKSFIGPTIYAMPVLKPRGHF